MAALSATAVALPAMDHGVAVSSTASVAMASTVTAAQGVQVCSH